MYMDRQSDSYNTEFHNWPFDTDTQTDRQTDKARL